MKHTLLVLLFGVGAVVFPSRAEAHHFFASTYIEDQQVTVEGELVQFFYRKPHSFIHVETKDPATGELIRWAVEWGAGGQLGRQGVTRDTLRSGDHLILIGNPGRNADNHQLRVVSISPPSDGWKWGGTFECSPVSEFTRSRKGLPI